MRVLIFGGPGSGCTSTARRIGEEFDLQIFDSDAYFHKPSDPPFQEQYSVTERRERLSDALPLDSWILGGSIATWDMDTPEVEFGIFLDIPSEERLRRIEYRQRSLFGSRIDEGGDLHKEHTEFLLWAEDYEARTGRGRNRETDREYLINQSKSFIEITQPVDFESVVAIIRQSLAEYKEA